MKFINQAREYFHGLNVVTYLFLNAQQCNFYLRETMLHLTAQRKLNNRSQNALNQTTYKI